MSDRIARATGKVLAIMVGLGCGLLAGLIFVWIIAWLIVNFP